MTAGNTPGAGCDPAVCAKGLQCRALDGDNGRSKCQKHQGILVVRAAFQFDDAGHLIEEPLSKSVVPLATRDWQLRRYGAATLATWVEEEEDLLIARANVTPFKLNTMFCDDEPGRCLLPSPELGSDDLDGDGVAAERDCDDQDPDLGLWDDEGSLCDSYESLLGPQRRGLVEAEWMGRVQLLGGDFPLLLTQYGTPERFFYRLMPMTACGLQ